MNETIEITNKRKYSFSNFILSYAFYLVFMIVFIFFSLTTKEFLTISNISTLLLQAAPLAIVTSGLAFVLISGDFDISVGSVAFISVSMGALAIEQGFVSTILGVIVIVLSGAVLGFINGIMVTRLKVPAFIATIGMLIGGRGIGLTLTAEKGYIFIPDVLREFSKLKVGPIYVEVIVAIVIMVIAQFILRMTPFGKNIFAIGNNEKSAQHIGINLKFIKLVLFTLSGFFAAIGGLIYLTQVGNVHAQFAYGWEFVAITMAVIGGVSLFGGVGNIIPGILTGVILVVMIDNGLNILGASPYLYPFIKGLIIFMAISADSFKNYIRRSI